MLIAALAALAAVQAAGPPANAHIPALTGALCAAAALLVLAALLAGIDEASLALPIGPPGGATQLALDPLSACFLLLVFIAAVPCALAAGTARDAAPARLAALPASLAATTLTLLAADPFTLMAGLALSALSAWALSVSDASAPRQLGAVAFGIVCLTTAFALASTSPGWLDHDFAALRAAPPQGWRLGAVAVLGLTGAGAVMPWPAWLPRSGRSPACSDGIGTVLGFYVAIRLLFDLGGSAQTLWWGVALIVLGAAAALHGSLRANFAGDLHAALSVGTLHQVGVTAISLGMALLARSADLPSVTSLALDAASLQIVGLALCRTLLLLCAAAACQGAGTRHLDLLGGLIHRMPVVAICTLAGLFGILALPPGLGFAGSWLLFQSLLGATRVGGFPLQLLLAAVVASVGLSMGLAAIAAVRLFGVAFLGRPRAPRTAAAEEPALPVRLSLIGLASLTVLLGLFPGIALLPARRAFSLLIAAPPRMQGVPLLLTPDAGMPGYAPLAIAALLALAG